MSAYYVKKNIIVFVLFAAFGIVLGIWQLFNKHLTGLVLVLASSILFYTFLRMKNEAIFITTDEYLKKNVIFGKEQKCKWEWIIAIRSEITKSTGDYFTHIYWSKSKENQTKEFSVTKSVRDEQQGMIVISSTLANYGQLLNEIISKTSEVDVDIDEMTKKIISKFQEHP